MRGNVLLHNLEQTRGGLAARTQWYLVAERAAMQLDDMPFGRRPVNFRIDQCPVHVPEHSFRKAFRCIEYGGRLRKCQGVVESHPAYYSHTREQTARPLNGPEPTSHRVYGGKERQRNDLTDTSAVCDTHPHCEHGAIFQPTPSVFLLFSIQSAM